MDVSAPVSAGAVGVAVGEELRRAREARGWSRGQLSERLPSGVGDRTILSYEHGTRQLSVVRLLELCQVLGVSAPDLLTRALRTARIYVQNLVLRVDLHAVLRDETAEFRPLCQWARNKLNDNPEGAVDIAPVAVKELAAFVGCSSQGLMNYLAGFAPADEGVVIKAG